MEYFFVDQTSCSCLMNVDLSNDTIQGKGLAKVKSLTYKLKYNMCISYVYVYHMHMYICDIIMMMTVVLVNNAKKYCLC